MSDGQSPIDSLEEALTEALDADAESKDFHIRNALQLIDALRE